MQVTVLGCGAWATTLAKLVAENHHTVTLWCHREAYTQAINTHHENTLSLPGTPLPKTLKASLNLEQSLQECDALILGVPSAHLEPVRSSIATIHEKPLLSLIKGIASGENWQLSKSFRHHPHYAVLSGPNLAKEIAAGLPAATVVASTHESTASLFQKIITRPYFRVYTHSDVAGVELGGILKNVMALAAGICDGLELGANAKASLLTRSLKEITQIATSLGAKAETLIGLSGLGDLIATCHSPQSRNWQMGYTIGQGKSTFEMPQKGVPEGVRTTPILMAWALEKNLELPITSQIHEILSGAKTPQEAIATLMTRQVKSES